MYKFIPLFLLMATIGCNEKKSDALSHDIGRLAEDYVRLALVIGQYDTPFVDAYYGPDSLKPVAPPSSVFPKDSLINAVSHA